MSQRKAVPFSLNPLDTNFVGAKPIESVSDDVILKLEAENRLIITRKRNGNAAYVAVTGSGRGGVGLYSRGIHNQTEHFPEMVEKLRSLRIPSGTLLAGELLVQVKGIDSPEAFSRFARSKPERAVELQRNEGARIKLALFNIIAHADKMVLDYSFQDRLDMLRSLVAKNTCRDIEVVEVLDMPFNRAKQWSIGEEWEGLVLYDAQGTSAFRMDGKIDETPRPLGCWKWKQYVESDFIATGWNPSDAKSHKGAVKDFPIAQYDPTTKKLVSWGVVGIGITPKERREYANDSLYPMVFEVKFERRTPRNRLIHARILRRRFDKKPEECIGPYLQQ